MTTDELVIDETNFDQHFFDVRRHGPRKGQVLACYTSFAEFVDGNLKRDILHILLNTDKVEAASRVLQKVGGVTAKDSRRIVSEMCNDLLNGLSPAEVAAKPYEMQIEMFYYTDLTLVPTDDPHWWHTKIIEAKLGQDIDGEEKTPLPEDLWTLRQDEAESV